MVTIVQSVPIRRHINQAIIELMTWILELFKLYLRVKRTKDDMIAMNGIPARNVCL